MCTYGSAELYGVLGNHSGDALVRAVATEVTGIHLSVVLAPDVLDGDDAVGHVQLVIAAAGWVNDDHNRHSVVVLVTDQARALIWINGVQLDQVGSLA